MQTFYEFLAILRYGRQDDALKYLQVLLYLKHVVNLLEPSRILTMLRAAPLTTSLKSLFKPTCFAYFCKFNKRSAV